ncbi:MAG: glycosyltransferase family 2 protein [Alphaproteobacteria bacterium]|nr:glycosyltransferase family 2 protein [Alphaproteobacteria bacterium]
MQQPQKTPNNTSVITVSYYTGSVLYEMIASVLAQDGLAELIVVNNGNSFNAIEKLEAMAVQNPKFKFITGHGNVGFAKGNNIGAKTATGEYLFLLNPDSVLEAGDITKLMAQSQKLQRPHLIGPRILDANGKEQSGSRRGELTPWNALVEVFFLYKLFPKLERWKWHDAPLPNDITEVPAISGAAMFLPRDDFFLVGGLDEGYFLHVEDVDFCFSLRKAGAKIFFMPQLAVKHIGATSDAPKPVVERHKTISLSRYFHKNFKDSTPLPLLWILDGAIWARFYLYLLRSKLATKKH